MDFLPYANAEATRYLASKLRADGIANQSTAMITESVVNGARMTLSELLVAMIRECDMGKIRLLATMVPPAEFATLPADVREMLSQ